MTYLTECIQTENDARAVLRDPVTGNMVCSKTYKTMTAAKAAATRYIRKVNFLWNLCFTSMLDGGTEIEPLTLEDAKRTMQDWRREDPEILSGIGPVPAELFRSIWNETARQLQEGGTKA